MGETKGGVVVAVDMKSCGLLQKSETVLVHFVLVFLFFYFLAKIRPLFCSEFKS